LRILPGELLLILSLSTAHETFQAPTALWSRTGKPKAFRVAVIMAMSGSELSRVLNGIRDQRERGTAGFVLGSLPKKQARKWTGWIGQDRFWRGRCVVLPDGRVAEVYGVVRQQVIARWHDPYSVDPIKVAVFKAGDLQVFKLPAAAALGRCKKGVREGLSAQKAETSRINGCAPPRPGSRPRGRPRKRYP
jgi:hypothetical protein